MARGFRRTIEINTSRNRLPREIFMHNVVTRDTRRSGMATLRVPGRITQSKNPVELPTARRQPAWMPRSKPVKKESGNLHPGAQRFSPVPPPDPDLSLKIFVARPVEKQRIGQ